MKNCCRARVSAPAAATVVRQHLLYTITCTEKKKMQKKKKYKTNVSVELSRRRRCRGI